MMRKIRIFSVILFLFAVVAFFGYEKYTDATTDSTGPVISMDEDSITVSIEDSEEAILAGITAVDEKDGDVSGSLIIESISNFIGENQRTATIVAFDSDSHVTKVSRTVIYSDYHSPRFSLSAPLKFAEGASDLLTYLSAEDVLDGDVTSQIKTSSGESIDLSEAGKYSVEFSVTNSAGDVATLPVTVEVYDITEESKKPQIELSQYLVYTDEKLDLWAYLESITMDSLEYTRYDGDDDAEEEELEGDAVEEDGDAEEEKILFQLSDDSIASDDITASEGITASDSLTATDDTRVYIYESDITIKEDIDYTEPGTYEVLYEVEDEDGEKGSVRLIVVVE